MPEVLLKKGTAVQVRQPPPIKGEIKKIVPVDDGERVEYLVAYTDVEGNPCERHFSFADLEVIE